MNPVPLVFTAILLSACAGPPTIVGGADPSNADVSVPPVRYVPVTAGTADHGVVSPRSWIEQNQSVTPKRGGE